MNKQVITHEQADKIRGWGMHTGYPSKLLELHVKKALSDSKCLQSLSLDELARALYVGHEVKEQFKDGNWLVNTHNKYDKNV